MPASTTSSKAPDAHLWITVLAGGIGSRFWPLSTPARPKQLLPLAGDRPIVVETVERARSLVPPERIRILAGGEVADRIVAALPELPQGALLREPLAKGTAPVLTWAAWTLARNDPDAVLVSLHSDHVIQPLDRFQSVIRRAVQVARSHQRLVTVGVVPDRPETGYGYLAPGTPLDLGTEPEAATVRAFVEKPDARTAATYIEQGFLWNSGIFVWKAAVFLDQVRAVAPELAAALPLLEARDVAGFFEAVPTVQVDVAVLERSPAVATVRATFSWDDVGSWEALARTRPRDANGNVRVGDVWVTEGKENIVVADEGTTVLFGVDDLVVVRAGEVTLVTHRSLAPHLKRLLDTLPDRILEHSGGAR